MKIYTLFSSWSANVGDDIQTFAVEQMLGGVDGYVDRENIAASTELGILVANGWWKHREGDFPPAGSLNPAYVGIHFACPESFCIRNADHLRMYGPIGCRDHWTLSRLQRLGIPAYFSNCLTLGLERWIPANPDGPIVAVDLLPGCKLPPETLKMSHTGPMNSHPQHMRDQTMAALCAYQQARLVVTSRLHVALPCLAFGTPVVLLVSDPDDPRLGPVKELVPVLHNPDSLVFSGTVLTVEQRQELQKNAIAHLGQSIEAAMARSAGKSTPKPLQLDTHHPSRGKC